MKNILIFGFAIIMIFFKSTSHAEYEKIFFDFKIKSIRGDTIDLNDFKKRSGHFKITMGSFWCYLR